jgi:hypothetical protein
LTFGVWRPAIALPADAREWDERDVQRALVHELEHVARRDWVMLIVARAICALYWFHPLAWIAWRRLALEAERACDDAVVSGTESADYATQLVGLAERLSAAQTAPMLGMAKRSDLAARVTAVLDAGQRRGRAGFRVSALIAATAALLVLVVAPTRAVATSATVTIGEIDVDGQRPPGRRQRALDRELYEAAENGDIEGVREMLEAGANVNAVLDGDGSPLIAAARRGGAEMVRFLVELGADINLGVPGDGNPLIAAAAEGHAEIVALLLDRGAHVDTIVAGDETALIQASGEGHLAVVRLLVERGANVEFGVMVTNWLGEQEWRSPLAVARRAGHADIVSYLQSVGARQ